MPRRDDDEDDMDDRPRRSRRRDDDDDFDDRPRRDRPDTASRIMLIIAGVILTIVLMCGGLLWYVVSSINSGAKQFRDELQKQMDKSREEMAARQKEEEEKRKKDKDAYEQSDHAMAKKAANEFLQNVSGRRFDAMRDMGTAKFKERMTEDALKTLIEDNKGGLEGLKTFREDHGNDKPISGSTFTFSGDIFGKPGQGFMAVKVTMIKEGTTWKVDQFLIEPKR